MSYGSKTISAAVAGEVGFESYVWAYLSAAQAIPAVTFTKINIDTAYADNLGEFDVTNKRIVIKEKGRYLVIGGCNIATGALASDIFVNFYVNGSVFMRGIRYITGGNHSSVGIMVVDLNAGDYLELYFYSSIAGNTEYGRQIVFLTTQRLY